MYAQFHNRQFVGLFAGTPGLPGPDASHYTQALNEQELARLRAINRSGFEATAERQGSRLTILPTTVRRAVQVRVAVTPGAGGTLLKDPHRQSLAQVTRRLGDDLDLEPGEVELQALATWAVRSLLEDHPAPSREHLLETFQGLWPVTHQHFRSALKEGLLNALTKLGEPDAAALVAQAAPAGRRRDAVA